MGSLPQGPEQAPYFRGFPLRPLVWSAALHGLVLGLLVSPLGREGQALAPAHRLQAHLQTLPAAAAEYSARPLHDPVSVKAAQPAPAVLASHAAQAAVLPAPTFAVPPPAAANDAGGMPALRETQAAATVALATEARESGPDASGLRQFRLALAGEARRFKRYPEAARRNGLAGTAEVRVAVDALGEQRLAELVRSSGHAQLDAAALDMMRLAAARTRLPESLRGQRFAVLMPVLFEVED